ncbi:unnamed protein product [Orchesella dallaii]|uniref:Uncharacterized protein n=1 Tax=Orchesella dallaii TaxID=48710 RepID=A0ABP1PZR3_9HEXA
MVISKPSIKPLERLHILRTRYLSPWSLIIGPIDSLMTDGLKPLKDEFMLRQDTILLLIMPCTEINSYDCLIKLYYGFQKEQYDSTIILIFPHVPLGDHLLALVSPHANGVAYVPELFASIVSRGLLTNPELFNRHLLWSQHGNQIPAMFTHDAWTMFRIYGNKYEDCTFAVWNAKYKISMYCDYDIMTAIYLGEVHNISINLVNSHVVYGENATRILQLPQSIGYSALQGSHYSAATVREHSVSGYHSEQLLYCVTPACHSHNSLSADIRVWTEPFSLIEWIIGLLLLYLECVLFHWINGLGSGILTLFTLLSSQGIQFVKGDWKLFIFLEFSARMLSNLWGNEITSLMVAPPTETRMETLKEFVESGYKVLYPFYNGNPVGRYTVDLNVSGVRTDERDLYIVFNETDNWYAMLVDETKRLAFPMPSKRMVYQAWQMKVVDKSIQNNRCVREWHALKQKLLISLMIRRFHTFNKHWLYLTILRMHDSGLVESWERLFKTFYLAKYTVVYYSSYHRGPALIDWNTMLPIFLVWLFTCGVGALVLLVELTRSF